MKRIIYLGWLAFCIAMTSNVFADIDAVSAQRIVEEAMANYQESRSRGHAWQKTRVHLDKAQAAMDDGDYELAVREAGQSIALAKASIAQADAELTAWRTRFPR